MSKSASNLKGWLWAVIFLGVGAYMIIEPDLLEGMEITGRRALLKRILRFIWGYWGGAVFIILGALTVVGILKGDDDDTESAESIEKD